LWCRRGVRSGLGRGWSFVQPDNTAEIGERSRRVSGRDQGPAFFGKDNKTPPHSPNSGANFFRPSGASPCRLTPGLAPWAAFLRRLRGYRIVIPERSEHGDGRRSQWTVVDSTPESRARVAVLRLSTLRVVSRANQTLVDTTEVVPSPPQSIGVLGGCESRTSRLGLRPQNVTAVWRLRPWRRAGWGCRGRRPSAGRRNPGACSTTARMVGTA
jgi:hypothetical protein